MIKSVVDISNQLMRISVSCGNIVVDATCGNGNDTLTLSQLVGDKGMVYAFDIQQSAIDATKKKLMENDTFNNVQLILDSHANIGEYVKDTIDFAVFNLGYLPGGEKSIVSKPESTIEALKELLVLMNDHACILMCIYLGHPSGKAEYDAIIDYCTLLDQSKYDMITIEHFTRSDKAPKIIVLEKK